LRDLLLQPGTPILHFSYSLNLAEMTVSAEEPNGGNPHVRIWRGCPFH